MRKIICVDMDYYADPLWLGIEDVDEPESISFINECLTDYEDVLSNEVLHSLTLFQSTWESFHSSKYKSVFSAYSFPGSFSTKEYLSTLAFLCASQIKKEHPEWRVFYTSMYDYERTELK